MKVELFEMYSNIRKVLGEDQIKLIKSFGVKVTFPEDQRVCVLEGSEENLTRVLSRWYDEDSVKIILEKGYVPDEIYF